MAKDISSIKKISVKKHLAVLLCVYALIAGLFFLYPQIDLQFSMLFYKQGFGFPFASTTIAKLIGYASRGITALVLLACALLAVRKFLQTKQLNFKQYKDIVFVIMVFIVGAVLLVQFGLKNHSHRPRPYNIVEFAGEQEFVQFSQIGQGECIHNCSFSSGHAAVGYACICFAFLPFFRRYCTKLKLSGWCLGTVLGISRVATGHHFLSDVLFSGFVVYLTILLFFWCFYSKSTLSTLHKK